VARRAPQEEASQHAQQQRPEGRVEVEHRKIGHRGLLAGLQVAEVVADVFTRGEFLRCCHR
jgi:hypothetical protein